MNEINLDGTSVLLVEDEFRIATLINDMLEECGCHVAATATNLDDALEKATSVNCDVALLDVNLNGDASYAVAQVLAQRGVPFVFSTGYTSSHVPSQFCSAPVVQKPFMLRDLERALRSALLNAHAASTSPPGRQSVADERSAAFGVNANRASK